MRVKQASLAKDFKSSFLSAEKDQQLIWRKLFVENRPYSDYLKRLLVINTEDCLDESKQQYRDVLKDYSLKKLREDGYLRVVPKLSFGEHEEVKSYIILPIYTVLLSKFWLKRKDISRGQFRRHALWPLF